MSLSTSSLIMEKHLLHIWPVSYRLMSTSVWSCCRRRLWSCRWPSVSCSSSSGPSSQGRRVTLKRLTETQKFYYLLFNEVSISHKIINQIFEKNELLGKKTRHVCEAWPIKYNYFVINDVISLKCFVLFCIKMKMFPLIRVTHFLSSRISFSQNVLF